MRWQVSAHGAVHVRERVLVAVAGKIVAVAAVIATSVEPEARHVGEERSKAGNDEQDGEIQRCAP